MKFPWQRFINQRSVLIILMMLLIAYFLQLREGYFSVDRQSTVYLQQQLVVDRDCDVTQGKCNSSRDELRLSLALLEQPGALQSFPAEVNVEGLGSPEHLDIGLVFSMKGMDMGDLRQKLVFDRQTKTWRGQVILPICSTGRRDWLARVDVINGDTIYTAAYEFTLTR